MVTRRLGVNWPSLCDGATQSLQASSGAQTPVAARGEEAELFVRRAEELLGRRRAERVAAAQAVGAHEVLRHHARGACGAQQFGDLETVVCQAGARGLRKQTDEV